MNKMLKLLTTILLVLSLTLCVTSCENITAILDGVDLPFLAGDSSEQLPDVGEENFGGEQLPEQKPEEQPEEKPEEKPEEDKTEDSKPEDSKPENKEFEGGIIYLPNEEDPITSDPYVNVNKTEFYANYTPAISYMDSYYRTKHNLMSGSISDQAPEPTVSDYQPEISGSLVRNTSYIFSEDGNTYYVVNAYGQIVNEIYKGGAYVTLEEVAAYVFAFGEPPANHNSNKNTKPANSPWGEYLRVNHSNFSGDTVKYPYEPALPNITGCGGSLYYYEMDIGTTGTDTGNGYKVAVYNNGSTITRGAARIVYGQYDLDRDGVLEVDETYLFYTYNHYNDFQEYLNYEGGWGEMFGNITGGGILSSKTNCNPTRYVRTAYASFVYADGTPAGITEIVVVWMPKREEVEAS